MTGDFLFSTFGGGDQVFIVQGFLPPPPPPGVPEPSVVVLLGVGLVAIAAWARRHRARSANV